MDLNEYQNQKPLIYDSENDFFGKKTLEYTREAGILSGVESFLKGLPDSVKHSLSAGELTEIILNMIADLREKGRREDQ